MASFVSSFYRVNANNTAIATSASGSGTPTEEIGKIVLSAGTIAFSTASAVVTGTSTQFQTDTQFQPGLVLVYLNSISNEIDLVGIIASVDSETQITLVENAANTDTGVSCAATAVLINANENYYTRFTPNLLSAGQILEVPDLTAMKTTGTGWTNPSLFSLTQFSDTGDINAEAPSPTNIDQAISAATVFSVSASNTANWFTTSGNFPAYVWALINPNGSRNVQLAESTLFKILCRGVLPSVQFTANQNRSVGETYGWK